MGSYSSSADPPPALPIETTPILLLRLTEKAASRNGGSAAAATIPSLLKKHLERNGLVVLAPAASSSLPAQGESHNVLLITTTQQALEHEAEQSRLMKPRHLLRIVRRLPSATATTEKSSPSSQHRSKEQQSLITITRDLSTESSSNMKRTGTTNDDATTTTKTRITIMDYFTVKDRGDFIDENGNAAALFTADEKAYLVMEMFDRIMMWDHDDDDDNSTGRRLYAALVSGHDDDDNNKINSDDSYHYQRRTLHYILQSFNYLDVLIPLHQQHEDEQRTKIQRELFSFDLTASFGNNIINTSTLDKIYHYYGPSIAFYFAFMRFLCRWISVLGVFGLSTYTLRTIRGDTIDEDEYTPFYGVLCFVWSIIMYKFWERRENDLAYRWGLLALDDSTSSFSTVVSDNSNTLDAPPRMQVAAGQHHYRPDFSGVSRTSPITGQPELYYSHLRRKGQYLVSALVTSLMLGLAFWIMILSLNLQGYIVPAAGATTNMGHRHHHHHSYHPFHFPTLATLADDGQWFDINSAWKCYIPVILHVVCINLLNALYRHVAHRLTSWENHVTQDAYDDSLVLKRFLFEAFDCYIVLFYLAFYERDVDRLRSELVSIFHIDTVRRIATEVILPIILHRFNGSHDSRHDDGVNSSKGQPQRQQQKVRKHHRDLDLDEYEPFDDYMEILIDLGYVILFASAYPLASMLMCGAIWIEVRSDCYKLTYLCQKPIAERIPHIGMWKALLQSMIWFSCLTNCLLFGFTSEQMMHYIPSLYVEDERGDAHLVHDKGWMAVFVIFGCERILIYLGLALFMMIPSRSEQLTTDILKRRYYLSLLHQSSGSSHEKEE